jgi:hypothetical protein
VPNGLGVYLPGGGNPVFRGTYYQMRWIANGRGRAARQSIRARISDGAVCQSVAGLLGGTRNRELTIACGRNNGTVTLAVDR